MKKLAALICCMLLALTYACRKTSAALEQDIKEASPLNPIRAVETTSLAGFQDVPASAWFSQAIDYVYQEGLMSGESQTLFSPDKPLSRAALATILWRLAGKPEGFPANTFSDAAKNAWYSKSIDWASGKGIMSGYNSQIFGVDQPTTREQMATVLYRYLGTPALSKAKQEASIFIDEDQIAEYAKEAARYLGNKGILTGKEGYLFDGKAVLKRAEAAAILMRMLQAMEAGSIEIPDLDEEKNTGNSTMNETNDRNDEQSDINTNTNTSTNINTSPDKQTIPYDGIYPEHEPLGKGIGLNPGRVVWGFDRDTVDWDGSGYWWNLEHFDEAKIEKLVDDSISALAGSDNIKEAWNQLFISFNAEHGKKEPAGYQPGEKIAIKCNINGSAVMDDDTSGKTNMSYTNPVLLKSLLTSLVKEGGVNPEDISVYDVSRLFPDYMIELCTQGDLKGVHFVGRDNAAADYAAPVVWSRDFGGSTSYLPTVVTEAKYLINLANLKGHSYGITLCGKNHFGSFLNGNSMRPPEGASLHMWLTKNQMGLYSPLVDLMANKDLGGKTLLYLLDALICSPSEGASITKENSTWKQAPFNGDFTSSIFVSQDPVAIDSVGADFLMNEPAVTENNYALRNNPNVENYLHEAGLVENAPSAAHYTDSNGKVITNLGVHEHWNNSKEKLYSRNLGESEGIELVALNE